MKGSRLDRTARLDRLKHLLYQNRDRGISAKKLAEICSVTPRQIYRDLQTLNELEVPVWEGRGLHGMADGYYLPQIHLELSETMTLFLAARLLLNYSNAYNPAITSTFMKLNTIVPQPLKDQIEKTLEYMKTLRKDERFTRVMNVLARSWLEGRRVRISYQALGKKKPLPRVIEPYFIQPAAFEHGNYVIAWCHMTKDMRTFKLERIQEIELLDEKYTVPADFDANKYLGTAFGISAYGDVETIKLRFDPVLAPVAMETTWHPSQTTKLQPDGSAIVTFRVTITEQLETFVRGWGERVEVLGPKKLRDRIFDNIKNMIMKYKSNINTIAET